MFNKVKQSIALFKTICIFRIEILHPCFKKVIICYYRYLASGLSAANWPSMTWPRSSAATTSSYFATTTWSFWPIPRICPQIYAENTADNRLSTPCFNSLIMSCLERVGEYPVFYPKTSNPQCLLGVFGFRRQVLLSTLRFSAEDSII